MNIKCIPCKTVHSTEPINFVLRVDFFPNPFKEKSTQNSLGSIFLRMVGTNFLRGACTAYNFFDLVTYIYIYK